MNQGVGFEKHGLTISRITREERQETSTVVTTFASLIRPAQAVREVMEERGAKPGSQQHLYPRPPIASGDMARD